MNEKLNPVTQKKLKKKKTKKKKKKKLPLLFEKSHSKNEKRKK